MLEFQHCEHDHYQIYRKLEGSLGKVSYIMNAAWIDTSEKEKEKVNKMTNQDLQKSLIMWNESNGAPDSQKKSFSQSSVIADVYFNRTISG